MCLLVMFPFTVRVVFVGDVSLLLSVLFVDVSLSVCVVFVLTISSLLHVVFVYTASLSLFTLCLRCYFFVTLY